MWPTSIFQFLTIFRRTEHRAILRPEPSPIGAVQVRVSALRLSTTEHHKLGGVWSVPTMGSFLSSPDKVGIARAVLQHCAQTFKLNPAWMEKQKQLDAYALQYQRARQQQRMQALAQQVQQFEAKMQAMRDQVAGFERHQAAQASQVEGFTQALRGVTPTIDPFTGEAREVWTGPQEQLLD